MILIKKVRISGFRSIKDDTIEDLGNFSTLVGTNNSGKSNYLRALNLFFNEEIEPGISLDINRDYYKPDAKKRKKKKKVKISVFFNIPDNFKFNKRLENVKNLLLPKGKQDFSITKEWTKDYIYSTVYLNKQSSPLKPEERQKVEQFLNLISFRYIPNRILPLEIIKKEHPAIKNTLFKKILKKKNLSANEIEIFNKVSEKAVNLVNEYFKYMDKTIPNVEKIILSTPSSLSEFILPFSYSFRESDVDFQDSLQGSGTQSFLMFNHLFLIDKSSSSRQFGWKQATIWAVEEPESSLHFSLEDRMGEFLSYISQNQKNHFQIITTTHSETIIQYSDRCYLIKKSESGSKSKSENINNILNISAKEGVSGWTHPVLKNPFKFMILVEGKYDKIFFEKALTEFDKKILEKSIICCLEDITLQKEEKGGIDAIKGYLKNNKTVIDNRILPIILIVDWDASDKIEGIKKLFKEDSLKILVWDKTKANPKLDNEFRGIERFFSDRILEEIKQINSQIVFFNDLSKYTVRNQDYDNFKKLASEIIKKGLTKDDISFASHILEDLKRIVCN